MGAGGLLRGAAGGNHGQPINKFDFMQFSSEPHRILSHMSFLLTYLTSLFLLEYVASPHKLISRLLTHKAPEECRITSSNQQGGADG